MRCILPLLLILAGCNSNIWDTYAEDTFKKSGSKKDYFEGNEGDSDVLTMLWPGNISSNKTQEKTLPKVKIHLSQNNEEYYTWDMYVRYSIEVSDTEDGDSKYGEINKNEVLLEIEFLPITVQEELKKENKMSEKEPEHIGLSLIKKSTCFGCHADKTALAGPSFSKIAERYEKNPGNIKSLAKHIVEGSTGEWGSIGMPSHPDITIAESEQIADYMLTQGGRKNNWVLPGLEGTFRIIKKPDNVSEGVYILTASYTSTTLMKGQHAILLHIK